MPINTFGIAMCDNDECELKDRCKRFKYNFLAEYDFSEVRKVWSCFIEKGEIAVAKAEEK